MSARTAATPIVLVVLAAGAAAYAFLVDRSGVPDADRTERRTDVFPSFRGEDVTRIELHHDREALVLERAPDGGDGVWEMASPRREQADGAAVDMLVRELEMATKVRAVPDAGVADGLSDPRATGSVTLGALSYAFALGADAPRPEGAAYFHVDGEGTFVVERSLKAQLLRTAGAYRDRTLVHYGAGAIARLELRPASGTPLVLERHGASFRVAGDDVRASRSAVESLLGALADTRADSFLADDAAAAATRSPFLTLAVTPRDTARPRAEVLFGDTCPGTPGERAAVRTEPDRLAACVDASLVERLRVAPASLVDTAPFFAHPDEIEELRIEGPAAGAGGSGGAGGGASGGGARVDVARTGTGWHERAPEDRELPSGATDGVSALVAALTVARATEVIPAAKAPHVETRSRVTLVRTGGEVTEEVDVGPVGPDGTALLRRVDDGAVLRVPRAVARRFEPHPVALRPRPVWRVPFDAGAVVAIDDGCARPALRLDLHDGAWVRRDSRGAPPADGVVVADVLASLAHAKADAWLAEKDDGTFGLTAPTACTVTLTLADAAASPADGGAVDGGAATDAGPRRVVALTFGDAEGGGVYARATDDPAVFVASPGFREALVRLAGGDAGSAEGDASPRGE
ncbi:MAG TPA: DUF4340 domain-containing protein [Polyangiaceae bacterium]